ncbi:MAG TPA: beta-ketoacyl synthase N-terminal-like domain-containing protein, partial [Candidatus Saccharimonadales bacterium]|nr:beta-ketoacyl synthase N-terminal-like domain-containing protein [Candidatus Saccharimonadales bacterium]
MNRFEDNNRFVVTGLGMVSPVGNDPESAWQAVLRGEHGIQYVRDTLFAGYESLPISVAAPVKDFDLLSDPAFADRKKETRNSWDMSQQFVLWAGHQALIQARLASAESARVDEHGFDPKRFGIYMGTGVGGANHLAAAAVLLEKEKAKYAQALADGDEKTLDMMLNSTRLNPKTILKTLPGRVAGTPSIEFGARAFWEGVLKECASGNAAIISAIEAIKLGKADVVLAGGVEGDITPYTTGLFGAAQAVSKNTDPDAVARPFDAARDGLTMGQGAAALVIET